MLVKIANKTFYDEQCDSVHLSTTKHKFKSAPVCYQEKHILEKKTFRDYGKLVNQPIPGDVKVKTLCSRRYLFSKFHIENNLVGIDITYISIIICCLSILLASMMSLM